MCWLCHSCPNCLLIHLGAYRRSDGKQKVGRLESAGPAVPAILIGQLAAWVWSGHIVERTRRSHLIYLSSLANSAARWSSYESCDS